MPMLPNLPRIPRPRAAFAVSIAFAVLGVVLLFVPDTVADPQIPLWVLGAAFILFAAWLAYATSVELQRRRSEGAG